MLRLVIAVSVLLSLCLPLPSSHAQNTTTCSAYKFRSNKVFTSCSDLPYLNSFLHWNFEQSTGKLQMAYRQTGVSSSNWVAWAINPNAGSASQSAMTGAQSLVAFQLSNGNTRVYRAPIQGHSTNLAEGTLSYEVTDLAAEYLNKEMIIFGTWSLPTNATTILQVWQQGPVSSDSPLMHGNAAANFNSKETLDLLSGHIASAKGGSSIVKHRNTHAVLNVVSWGIMMPFGAMAARYLKVFNPTGTLWFYIHVICQATAYFVGVAGWVTGLILGTNSKGIQHHMHRNIGITLFCLGTLQVFALRWRPNPNHKYRFYWNIYHHATGYVVIILSIINVFKGFDILMPNKIWRDIYIGIIIALAVVAAVLEVYKWYVVLKRKRLEKAPPHGVNGANGYGA